MTSIPSRDTDGDVGRPDKNTVGVTIRSMRSRLGLTQVAFSVILSIRQNTLSQVETGVLKPSIERLIQLLRIARTEGEREPLIAALERRGILATDLAPIELSSAPALTLPVSCKTAVQGNV